MHLLKAFHESTKISYNHGVMKFGIYIINTNIWRLNKVIALIRSNCYAIALGLHEYRCFYFFCYKKYI